jgi:hypothetical protein
MPLRVREESEKMLRYRNKVFQDMKAEEIVKYQIGCDMAGQPIYVTHYLVQQ